MARYNPRSSTCSFALLALCAASGCGEAAEAPRVQLPVVSDSSGLASVTTDLGYHVHVTAFRMAISDLQFTVAGEVHGQPVLRRLLWPVARAHPGHYTGGEVLGELPGVLVLDWRAAEPSELGRATLIAGSYESVNFTLERARPEHGLAVGDPLLGHTALIEGSAERAGERVRFSARIDSPEARQIVGVPFEHEVRAAERERIGFAVVLLDPLEQDTLFDGIDFLALATDSQGALALDESASAEGNVAAYQLLRRTLQTHDHFRFRGIPAGESK